MFTGIIRAVGTVDAIEATGGDARLSIAAPGLGTDDLQPGDSIAVNGVCLTAINLTSEAFAADVSQETLAVTTLGDLVAGSPVNLEPALTLATPLGGHLVAGHVDATATLVSREPDARSTRMVFDVPQELMSYMARKGSVAIDGTSLTINDVSGSQVAVNIVPHTLERTIMAHYAPGTRVNIEVDLVARYLERLMSPQD